MDGSNFYEDLSSNPPPAGCMRIRLLIFYATCIRREELVHLKFLSAKRKSEVETPTADPAYPVYL